MHTLFQKKGFNSQKFTILHDHLQIETQTLSKKTKYAVKLERLGFELQYHATNTFLKKLSIIGCSIGITALTILAFVFPKEIELEMMFIFYVAALGIIIGSVLKQYSDDIYLVGPTNVIFYRNKPSEEEVLAFIEEVKIATKKFLKNKYTSFDEVTTAEEFYNCINWLYEKQVITRDEYIDYKASFDLQKLL